MLKKIALGIGGLLILVLLYVLFSTGSALDIVDSDEIPRYEGEVDWEAVTREATPLLQEFLRMRTIRADEHKASLWLRKILEKEGIATRIYRSPTDPSRSSLVAEILPTGEDAGDGIVLSSHTDVVEVERDKWKHDPFGGELIDGKIWGRGAIDMKGHTIMQLMAMLIIKRKNIPLKRKLMLLALADEETTAEHGALLMTSTHKDIFKGYKYALSEGGLGTVDVAVPGSKIFNIQFAEKGKLWIKLKTTGESGHGARPANTYALQKMVHFMKAVHDSETGVTVTPEMETFFYQMGTVSPFPDSFFLKRAGNPLVQQILTPIIRGNRYLTAMTTNTRALTALTTNEDEGINVIASEAYGKIDLRLLPGETTAGYLEKLKKIGEPYGVEIEVISTLEPNQSPTDSPMMQVLSRVAMDNVEGSVVTPLVSPGNTDNTHLRKIGLECYGLTPVLLNEDELGSTHSDNEYISLDNLKLGTKITFEAVIGMN